MYSKELNILKKRDRFRKREIFPENLIDFASNDYLGLASNQEILEKTYNSIKGESYGAKASLLVNGYNEYHQMLEEYLCEINHYPAGIVVGSGFLANLSIFESLARRGDLIIFDEEYHASGIVGSRLSQAEIRYFKHNNLEDLIYKLRDSIHFKRVFVAVEGIYSMRGDLVKEEILNYLSAKKKVPNNTLKLGVVVLSEIALGLFIGFLSMIIIEGFRLAGEIVGVQLGFGMVSVLDPESTTQDSMMDLFFYFIFVLIFLAMDFHHKFLIAMYETFERIPVGHLVYPAEMFKDVIFKVSISFVLAMKISFPLIAPGIIVIVILGIVSKTVPRMEVFLISFPLKIFMGFMTIILLLPFLPNFTDIQIDRMFGWLVVYLRKMGW